jgi:hypothetical protein
MPHRQMGCPKLDGARIRPAEARRNDLQILCTDARSIVRRFIVLRVELCKPVADLLDSCPSDRRIGHLPRAPKHRRDSIAAVAFERSRGRWRRTTRNRHATACRKHHASEHRLEHGFGSAGIARGRNKAAKFPLHELGKDNRCAVLKIRADDLSADRQAGL